MRLQVPDEVVVVSPLEVDGVSTLRSWDQAKLLLSEAMDRREEVLFIT